MTNATIPSEIKELHHALLSTYDAQLTKTLCSDSSNFIVSDDENYLWLFIYEQDGWEIHPVCHKSQAIYRWNEEMIGEVADFDVEAFAADLSKELAGVEVVKLDVQGAWTSSEFEETFADVFSGAFDRAIQNQDD